MLLAPASPLHLEYSFPASAALFSRESPLADRNCLVGRLCPLPHGQLTANWLRKVCSLSNCTLCSSFHSRTPCGIRLKSDSSWEHTFSSLPDSILLPSLSFSWDHSLNKSSARDSLSQDVLLGTLIWFIADIKLRNAEQVIGAIVASCTHLLILSINSCWATAVGSLHRHLWSWEKTWSVSSTD